MHPNVPSQTCPLGSTIKSVLTEVYHEVYSAVEGVLKNVTIGDMYRKMRARYVEAHNLTIEDMAEIGQEWLARS
jgi:hypothetical protein